MDAPDRRDSMLLALRVGFEEALNVIKPKRNVLEKGKEKNVSNIATWSIWFCNAYIEATGLWWQFLQIWPRNESNAMVLIVVGDESDLVALNLSFSA